MEKNFTVGLSCRKCKSWHSVKMYTENYLEWIQRHKHTQPRPVQEIFPYLEDWERELLVSKYCKDCWDKLFGEESTGD